MINESNIPAKISQIAFTFFNNKMKAITVKITFCVFQ